MASSGSDGFELIESLVNDLDEFPACRIIEPTPKADVEYGHPHVGGETRGGFRYAALLQAMCERGGERRAFDQSALLQVGVRVDDLLTLAG